MSEAKQKQETASTSVFPLQAGESSVPDAQSEAGIVCVGGTAPQKWLEGFAAQLDEQYTDEDTTSPIPDVLAIFAAGRYRPARNIRRSYLKG